MHYHGFITQKLHKTQSHTVPYRYYWNIIVGSIDVCKYPFNVLAVDDFNCSYIAGYLVLQ